MCPDHDIHQTFFEILDHLFLLRRRPKPRHLLNPDRIILHPLHKRIVMLLRQNRRRHQKNNLLAVLHRLKRCADCNLGFAIANVPADQAIHDFVALHVPLRRRNCHQLVIRFLKREHFFKLPLPDRILRKSVALPVLARRIQLHQILCDLIHCRPDTGLGLVPLLRSELV